MRPALSTLPFIAAALALNACDAKPLYVDNAYVRLSPNADAPSAAYFTVHAAAAPVTLRAVTSDAAVRVEMHDSAMHGGMMRMTPIDSVDVPAGGVVRFEPGGRHVMLWGVDAGVAGTGKIPMTFLFSNGDRIIVDAAVQKMGR